MNQALAQVVDRHLQRVSQPGLLGKVADEVAAFAGIVVGSPRLARVLANGDVSATAKRSLLGDLLGSKFHEATLDLLADVFAGRQRLSASELPAILLDVTAVATFAAAEQSELGDRATGQSSELGNRATGQSELQEVENGLYELAAIIRKSNELRSALTNPGVEPAPKQALLKDLLAGKANAGVLRLTEALLTIENGSAIDEQLQRLSELAAARRRLTPAEIRTAVQLDTAQRGRLVEALQRKLGQALDPRFTVDPSIIGSVLVRVGDEVLDGSVRHRLAQARFALIGA